MGGARRLAILPQPRVAYTIHQCLGVYGFIVPATGSGDEWGALEDCHPHPCSEGRSLAQPVVRLLFDVAVIAPRLEVRQCSDLAARPGPLLSRMLHGAHPLHRRGHDRLGPAAPRGAQVRLLSKARSAAATPKGRARPRRRMQVEHREARLSQLEVKRVRDVRRAKTENQGLLAVTIVNL